MKSILSIENVSKVYQGGFQALNNINLDIKEGEIFALLGPNGAGKTTLISIICGIVNLTSGKITVDGFDHAQDYKESRSRIGLVPQELTNEAFEKVINTVSFSRGLFGKEPNRAYIEKLLKDLTLFEKRNNKMMTLSGGMKRRVLIAKALSHEPRILFLDEPTAGVDVELRASMWELVRELRNNGVTIILTTHYIEEAEEMADRVGVINNGEIVLVEEKKELMKKLGKKQLIFELKEKLEVIPESLSSYNLSLKDDHLIFSYDVNQERSQMGDLLTDLNNLGINCKDLHTQQSSLEDIFVNLVRNP